MIDQAYIERINSRVDALEAELSRPETAANQTRFRSLVSEHLQLKEVQGKASRYLKLFRGHEEAKALLDSSGADDELRELAKAEMAEIDTDSRDMGSRP